MGAGRFSYDRNDRQHNKLSKANDRRTPSERDCDRIVYSTALRRLAGVTQVMGPDDGPLLHNRLTHSLKVGQLARRLAQRLGADQPEVTAEIGGVDPDVAEAAGLAHDLGHPPFGHLTEEVLDALLIHRGVISGFEGNPQTFRILTKLERRSDTYPGLDLTAATLRACLKYPWFRGTAGKRRRKWGAYPSEEAEFRFANPGEEQSPEAAIMDWADDITYAVHDVEDFYRAGLIPLDRLALSDDEQTNFFTRAMQSPRFQSQPNDSDAFLQHFQDDICRTFFPPQPYSGSIEDRATLTNLSSTLIDRYTAAIKLRVPDDSNSKFVEIDPAIQQEVNLLKELTWQYVIKNPALVAQQLGQTKVINGLFEILFECAEKDSENSLGVFPPSQRAALSALPSGEDGVSDRARIVADLIASMTEVQAVRTYHKLAGISLGSGLDLLLHQGLLA